MGRQLAIAGTELVQPLLQHLEMPGLVVGDLHPVVGEALGHPLADEAAHDVPGEVDGVQLDVGQRVEQGDTVLRAAAAPALGHVAGQHQGRTLRAGGAFRRGQRAEFGKAPVAPRRGIVPRQAHLLQRRRGGQNRDGRVTQRHCHPYATKWGFRMSALP
ncbi:hypothetical protein GCM10022293_25070 [Azospirillum formosense]